MARQFGPGQIKTGSLYDISSSFALTASYLLEESSTSSFAISSSYALSASYAVSASHEIIKEVSSSYADFSVSSSYSITASYAENANSSSYADVAKTAQGGTGSFTGSFTGDGSGLLNIPAGGIVGLNLSQIASGSVSASISPSIGLQVNTDVTAPAFSGSFSGSFQGDGSGLTGITATINTSSLVTTSSFNIFTSSIQSEVDNLTAQTGSYTITSSFNSFTSSIQTEVDNLTAQTSSYVTNSQTGSFATTGSNNFIGNQIITGSLTVSGSSTFTNIGTATFSGSVNVSSSIEADTLKVKGGVGNEGTLSWNSVDNTVDLQLNDVTLQLGQETIYHVINQTGTQINNGEVVYVTGVSSDKLSVAPYSASMNVEADLVLGLATEDIPDTQFGFITQFGMVRDVNTAGFGVGTILYADTGSSGYTNIAPTPPDHTIFLGFVTKEDATEGQIELNVRHLRDADEIKTNLSGSGLSSTNIQSALLELQSNKVDVGALSSNIILYPTTGSSPIPGYFRMVTDPDDPDYNTTAVDVNTGAISSSVSGQLIASLASDEGLFVGNPGIINVTTLGNIRKVSGNRDAYFYYELYQSSSSGETLIATSDNTPNITNTTYEEFFAGALLNNGIWSATDRVVIKYYGVKATSGGNDPTYQFQFGGDAPVRTLLPVPVSVVPSEDADGIQTNTSNFNNILSGADNDVQKALDTLDDHSHTLQEITDEGNTTTDRIIVGDLTVDTDTLYASGSNVGIGTTNLPEKLTVEGNISASGIVYGTTGSFSHLQGNSPIIVGDSIIFQQSITGSNILLTSSIIDFDTEVSRSAQVAGFGTDISALNTFTSSIQTEVDNLTAQTSSYTTTSSFNAFTSSYTTGSFTGSFTGDGSQLTGIVSSKWTGSNSISRQSDVEITGSFRVAGQSEFRTTGSGTVSIFGSGSTLPLFQVSGSQGNLISVNDITGSLFQVSDVMTVSDTTSSTLFTVSGSAGELFQVTDSNTGSLLTIYDSASNNIFNISSSADISHGQPSASAQLLTRKTTINNTGSFNTIYQVSTGSYDSLFADYVIVSGSNKRAGNIIATWIPGTSSYTDTSTSDLGSTSQVGFDISISGSYALLNVSASTSVSWSVKTIIKTI